jgi:hypothetical protein
MNTLRPGRPTLIAGMLGAILITTGCWSGNNATPPTTRFPDPTTTTTVTVPCAEPVRINLGKADPDLATPAMFTTDGSPLYFTAQGFTPGVVPFSDVGQSQLWLGDVVNPPVIRDRRVINATYAPGTIEDRWIRQDLAPGRYWLVTTNFVQIVVAACTPGAVTDVAPAPL